MTKSKLNIFGPVLKVTQCDIYVLDIFTNPLHCIDKTSEQLLKKIIIRLNAEDDDQSQPKIYSIHSDNVFLPFPWLWRLNAPHVQSVSGETRSGCSMAMTAAARSPPAAPVQRTVRMKWYPPSLPACPSSRTMAKSIPTPMERLEWVSTWICLGLSGFTVLWAIRICLYLCVLDSLFLQPLVRCVEWLEYVMLFTQKPSASAVCPVLGVIPQIPKKLASWQDSRLVFN